MKLSSIRIRLFETASPLDALLRYVRYRMTRRATPPGLQWARVAMYDSLTSELKRMQAHDLSALEISPGELWQTMGFRKYQSVTFPAFDICSQQLDERFD